MKNEILFEAAQDVGFLDRIASLPEGGQVLSCIQCGTCSGSCPVSFAMEHTPRRIFAMVRAGMRDQVLSSTTPLTIGLMMMMEGRMPLFPHRIKDMKGFREMVKKAEEIDRGGQA